MMIHIKKIPKRKRLRWFHLGSSYCRKTESRTLKANFRKLFSMIMLVDNLVVVIICIQN